MSNNIFNSQKRITADSICIASQDILCLIVDLDRVLQAYGISSLEFISDVFTCDSQYEQLGIIIAALQVLRKRMEQGEVHQLEE